MELSELVKKESLWTGEEIHIEKAKIKKERNWLEDNVETKANLSIEKNIDKESKNAKSVEKISLKYVKDVEKDLNYRKPILKIENKLSSKHRKDILISTDNSFNFFSIVGLQQRTMFLIFEHCKLIGSKETSALGINYFTEKLNISQLNAHNALNELLRKKVILKTEFKRGRGGYFRLKFEDLIWNIINLNIEKISLNYVNKNIEQTIETSSNSSSSFSLKDKKETTIEMEIPENLKNIISQREIKKLIEKGMAEENIEFSLKNFSYDLEHNLVKSKTSPINLFYGIVRSGNTYKSLKLMEIENEELKLYQSQLQILENRNKALKENELILKFQEFKINSQTEYEKMKSEQNTSGLKINEDVLDKIIFQKFVEEKCV